MTYRVVDTSINKLFGAFATEEEALTFVRTLVGVDEDYAEDIAVSCEIRSGVFTVPLSGKPLLARAEQIASEREEALSRPGQVIGSRTKASGIGLSKLPMAASDAGRWASKRAGNVRNAVRDRTHRVRRWGN